MEALNEHLGRKVMDQVISLDAELSPARIKPGLSPSDFCPRCVKIFRLRRVEIGERMADLDKPFHDDYIFAVLLYNPGPDYDGANDLDGSKASHGDPRFTRVGLL